MKVTPKALIDTPDAAKIVEVLNHRRPGYTPEWLPRKTSIGDALQWIFARYVQAIIQRLNLAPDKNLLAFLDVMGIEMIPGQAARAPVVFQLAEGVADTRIPAGTRVAAPPPPEGTDQIVFETERTAGIASAKLVEVASLWPGRDQYADHSAEHASGQPFELFKFLKDTPHAIYLAHDVLLALAGKTRIDVEFELTQPSSEHLDILWEYWDGKIWRGFKDMNPACGEDVMKLDATFGLTKSGKYHLETDCAETKKTAVNGIESFWIRGRLTEPMPPDPGKILPEIDGIRLSSVVERPLHVEMKDGNGGIEIKDGLLPDSAFFDTTELDLTNSFYPFGLNPQPGATFYFSSQEVFSKPGARVEIGIKKARSPQDELTGSNVTAIEHEVIWEYWNGIQWASFEAEISFDLFQDDIVELEVPDVIAPTKLNNKDGFWIRARLLKGAFGFKQIVTWLPSESGTGGITGQVTDSEGDPLEGVTVKIEGTTDSTVSDTSGLYSFGPIPTGIYTVSAPSIGSKVTNVWVRPNQTIIANLTSGVEIALETQGANQITYIVPTPPALAEFRLGYIWQYGPFHAEHVLTYNDFQYEDQTYNAKWPGRTFQPFRPPADVTPTVYLGFDKKLPNDFINLLFNIEEQPDQTEGPQMVWEYYNGSTWRPLLVEDETGNLALPGMVSFIAPADAGQLARFGTDRYWIRGRLKEDGPPAVSKILGLYHNAVWARQVQTVTDERLGLSNGQPNQVFVTRNKPVLADERIEVRELEGARAHVEWRILANELLKGNSKSVDELKKLLNKPDSPYIVEYGELRLQRDVNRKITEVWVRWQQRPHLFFSGPDDRHYMIERARGRIIFGDEEHGKIPPVGVELNARRYLTGGGAVGNVKAKEVTQLLSGAAAVQTVFNPIPAEGGADVENIDILKTRGPRTLRYRNKALTAIDFETMAFEANPAVAVARALPTRDAEGRTVPGWVTLVIIPKSEEARPWPSAGLRRNVREYIEDRAPADLAARGCIHVTGPSYEPVGIALTVAPVSPSQAGVVESRVRQVLQEFLHPLRGGPEGLGWEPGRDVYLSDVASVVERVEGVDYVEDLALLQDGLTQGDRVRIAPDRITVAGTIFLRMKIAE